MSFINNKYKIGLYNLSSKYIDLSKKYLNESEFELIELLEFDKLSINDDLNIPIIIIVDEDFNLTDDLVEYSKNNLFLFVKVTDKPKFAITNLNVSLSFATDVIQYNQLNKEFSYCDYSVIVLKEICDFIKSLRYEYLNKNSSLESKKDIYKTLVKLIYLIDSNDKYTLMHSKNVSDYAFLLGKELKLEEQDLELLKMGALLHDIGKIGILDYILEKKGTLTNKEYEIVKRHPVIGETLLPIGYEEMKKMIRYHHERVDGNGYPDGLKGSDIPYFARIISVADTFDAMTTQRVYNKCKTLDEAFKELIKVSEKRYDEHGNLIQQLDPYLVNTFIEAFKKDEILMDKFKQKDEIIITKRLKKH